MYKVETCLKLHFSICEVVGDSGKNSNGGFLRYDIIKWNSSFTKMSQDQKLICFAKNLYFGLQLRTRILLCE